MNLTLIVCQNDMFLNSTDYKYICCDFNLELKRCHSNNYIIAKYNGTVEYTYGFKNVSFSLELPLQLGQLGASRDGINYIIYENDIYTTDEKLIIGENGTIEMHFYDNITTLELLFVDQYAKEIISVDLSHFNSSLVTSTFGMFAECESITEINFTNFITSSVTNMEGMFYNCMNLRSLDLSNFNTSKVSSFNFMFQGCPLYYLDISNFDFSNSKIYCEESEIAMSLILMANYLNLYNAKNYYDHILVRTVLLNQKENIQKLIGKELLLMRINQLYLNH